jgi:hypothetical protein
MSCPLLRRSHPAVCRAVSDGPVPLGQQILAAYCRGPYGDCPAYRFVRASGHLVHPADFRAWVVQGVAPGQVDARPDGPRAPDAA